MMILVVGNCIALTFYSYEAALVVRDDSSELRVMSMLNKLNIFFTFVYGVEAALKITV